MRISDEALDSFYPRCVLCGEPIEADGYQIDNDYFCEDCIAERKIDGTEIAEEEREGRYEAAMETKFEASRDEY